MKTTILKLRDKDFKGFYCDTCGRELKHAFSINGQGTHGSECVYKAAGINYNMAAKAIKCQMTLAKLWNKMISNPAPYSLDKYAQSMGGIDEVERMFFIRGHLG
jgi:hypothetical protein